MSILFIIIGFVIARFGARLFVNSDSRNEQNAAIGFITLFVQLLGWGLIIWGLIRLFS
jgi:uncharacterized membrane protein YidH (DUF202 family)